VADTPQLNSRWRQFITTNSCQEKGNTSWKRDRLEESKTCSKRSTSYLKV
jgi:hypothetical protein